jgi:hypothetical protein
MLIGHLGGPDCLSNANYQALLRFVWESDEYQAQRSRRMRLQRERREEGRPDRQELSEKEDSEC